MKLQGRNDRQRSDAAAVSMKLEQHGVGYKAAGSEVKTGSELLRNACIRRES